MRNIAIHLSLIPIVFIAIPTLAADDAGFTPLFNGKDLSGWIYGTQNGKPNKVGKGYQVEDGILFCTPRDGGNLMTEKEYADFTLRFEFKLAPNANNGIGIRAPLEGRISRTGMEIQILDDDGAEYKNLKPYQYHGSIYEVVPAKRGHLKPVGQWNTQEITAKGRQITVKLNGTVIVDANLDDVKDPEILKLHSGIQNRKGHIGLLGHGTRVEFRNIEIKAL